MSQGTSLSRIWDGRSYVITGLGAVMMIPEPVPVPARTVPTGTVQGLSKAVICELEPQLVSSADVDTPFFRC